MGTAKPLADSCPPCQAPTAFPLDSLGFGAYTFPPGRQRESMSFLDPLEGTETTCDMVAWQCTHCL